MNRLHIRLFAFSSLWLSAFNVRAFCGDWVTGVAPGFDAQSWLSKLPVLLVILFAVGLSTIYILRRRLSAVHDTEKI